MSEENPLLRPAMNPATVATSAKTALVPAVAIAAVFDVAMVVESSIAEASARKTADPLADLANPTDADPFVAAEERLFTRGRNGGSVPPTIVRQP